MHASLDLVARVGELLSPSGEPLQGRTAIATGLVLIGENWTAVGEVIVVAGQLLAITPPSSVSVSASTRKLLGNVFVCDDPQRCELEGVFEPVTWYRVTGKRTGRRTRPARTQFTQSSAGWHGAKAQGPEQHLLDAAAAARAC